MGKPTGFLEFKKEYLQKIAPGERVKNYKEFEKPFAEETAKEQGARCMDCGIPFCHWSCPLGNKMPEWQDLVYKGKWQEAIDLLHETNNFPDFTGRICPALCEKSCVLALQESAVTIRENECAVTEVGFTEGLIKAHAPKTRTGKKIAVIGSGPAGMAAAQQLNRKGHSVTLFEKENGLGGLLRYGIPNFKLNKYVIDRRLAQLEEEGIIFKPNTEVGKDISGKEIMKKFDAVCLAIGAGHPRDINPEGRNLKGIHFALEFLSQQNQLIMGEAVPSERIINAKDKHVLVIGGGDTGSDCVGTSIRQGAVKVTQIEILPQPPAGKNPATPWPYYPNILKTSTSHEEGCDRKWCLNTKKFIGEKGKVTEVLVEEVAWEKDETGRFTMKPTGKTETIKADLVFLALGFVHPVHEGLLTELGVTFDGRGNVAIDANNKSNVAKVFAAGDASMGASLVVRAIASGRKVAEDIHKSLI